MIIPVSLQGGGSRVISNEAGAVLEGATVDVVGRTDNYARSAITTASGEYWKLLLPGEYTLQVELADYEPMTASITVVDGAVSMADMTLTSTQPSCVAHNLNYATRGDFKLIIEQAENKDNVKLKNALENSTSRPVSLYATAGVTNDIKVLVKVGKRRSDVQKVTVDRFCLKTSGAKKIMLEYRNKNGRRLGRFSKSAGGLTCFEKDTSSVHEISVTLRKKANASKIKLSNVRMEACVAA